MTVFVWKPASGSAADKHGDEFNTLWYEPSAECLMCGGHIAVGDKVMGWDGGGRKLLFHARCVKKFAIGLAKDIAECTR